MLAALNAGTANKKEILADSYLSYPKNLPEVMGSGALDALNVLHCSAAIEIEFSQGGTTKEVELVFENTINTHSFPRIFITCKKGSKGTVILNYQGSSENASFSNVSSFVEVEENANLSICTAFTLEKCCIYHSMAWFKLGSTSNGVV